MAAPGGGKLTQVTRSVVLHPLAHAAHALTPVDDLHHNPTGRPPALPARPPGQARPGQATQIIVKVGPSTGEQRLGVITVVRNLPCAPPNPNPVLFPFPLRPRPRPASCPSICLLQQPRRLRGLPATRKWLACACRCRHWSRRRDSPNYLIHDRGSWAGTAGHDGPGALRASNSGTNCPVGHRSSTGTATGHPSLSNPGPLRPSPPWARMQSHLLDGDPTGPALLVSPGHTPASARSPIRASLGECRCGWPSYVLSTVCPVRDRSSGSGGESSSSSRIL